jgi:hypothetical protein
MTMGIIWGCVCMIFFGKKYSKKLQKSASGGSGKKSFGDVAMTAMFIGLITAYVGSYIGEFVQLQGGKIVITGEYQQLVALIFSALAMAVFVFFAEKKQKAWLENFSIAGSMLFGMAAAVLCGILF